MNLFIQTVSLKKNGLLIHLVNTDKIGPKILFNLTCNIPLNISFFSFNFVNLTESFFYFKTCFLIFIYIFI